MKHVSQMCTKTPCCVVGGSQLCSSVSHKAADAHCSCSNCLCLCADPSCCQHAAGVDNCKEACDQVWTHSLSPAPSRGELSRAGQHLCLSVESGWGWGWGWWTVDVSRAWICFLSSVAVPPPLHQGGGSSFRSSEGQNGDQR